MRVGLSTACFYPETTERSLALGRSLGFDLFEVFVNAQQEFSMRFMDKLCAYAEKHALKIVSLHPYSSGIESILFFSGYSRRIADAVRQYEKYFKALSRLGGKYFTFHGARKVMIDSYITAGEDEFDIYRRLCDAAAKYDVVLCQENVVWTKSSDIDYLERLKEAVPALSFTLDIKQARRAEVDLDAYLTAMADRLVNIHISDYSACESCLLPGRGAMDYPAFFDKLRAMGYAGDVIIELYKKNYEQPDDLVAAKDFLQTALGRTAAERK